MKATLFERLIVIATLAFLVWIAWAEQLRPILDRGVHALQDIADTLDREQRDEK